MSARGGTNGDVMIQLRYFQIKSRSLSASRVSGSNSNNLSKIATSSCDGWPKHDRFGVGAGSRRGKNTG